jgi:hypothetical protein
MHNFSFKSKFNIYRLWIVPFNFVKESDNPIKELYFSSFGALMRYVRAYRKTERGLPVKKRSELYIEGLYFDKTFDGNPRRQFRYRNIADISRDGTIDFCRYMKYDFPVELKHE